MQCKKVLRTITACAAVLLGGIIAFADKGGTPQASITLQNCDAKYCYTHNSLWTLTKEVTGNTVTNGTGTITWTITATKSDGGTSFSVHGGLTIYNSGTAPATIGNIVVNLQKPAAKNKQNAPWVSIAADVANSYIGDDGTSANIVAAGSAENATVNAAQGPPNYTVSGAQGTFTETAGRSGALEFKDATSNTIFSLVPDLTIPVGQAVTLLYDATFQTAALPPAGTPLRVEALVTFGNAGTRSTSGSSATNIDINGDGAVDSSTALQTGEQGANDADEANVRTVPCRTTFAPLPAAPAECNSSVTVTDNGPTPTGSVTTSNWTGFGAFPATISETTEWTVSADVDSGAEGGSVCNTAQLDGVACGGTLSVVVGYTDPPANTIPIYATYECAPAALDSEEACADVPPPGGTGCTDKFCEGDFCTYTQGKYNDNANNPVANYLEAHFYTAIYPDSPLFPSGLTIGIADGSCLSCSKHDATWTDVDTFRSWIAGGGKPGALTADTLDATDTAGGALARQTAALTVTLALSGSTGGQPAGLGGLKLCNTGTSLDGKTISEIVAVANDALGGNGLPSDYTFGSLNTLLDNLNSSFDDCTPVSFAQLYICRP